MSDKAQQIADEIKKKKKSKMQESIDKAAKEGGVDPKSLSPKGYSEGGVVSAEAEDDIYEPMVDDDEFLTADMDEEPVGFDSKPEEDFIADQSVKKNRLQKILDGVRKYHKGN